MNDAILTARSFLFAPGNRPDRFLKAAQSGADAVILDLEDSVPEGCKSHARRTIAQEWQELVAASQAPLLVRIHAFGTEAWRDDVELLHSLAGLAGIVLPKAESADDLHAVRSEFPTLLTFPLIESARGWAIMGEIAHAPGVARLAIGNLDFIADTGMSPGLEESELGPLRFAVAMHTRSAGLATAIDGVTVQTDDDDAVINATLRARRYGFGGKLCIHPRQIPKVHAAFSPSQDERVWAERVITAASSSTEGAVLVDGRMVDRPVILKAKAILATSSRSAPSDF